jgi:drug/metabolite transporter (DMT)-like permease
MTATTSRRAGIGFALLSAACFSMSGSFARSLLDAGWTPGAAVAVRISVAALLLAIPAIVSLHGRWHLLRRDPVLLVTYGVVAFAGAQLCYFNAVQHISVGVALLLEYMGVVLVVGWPWLRHGQRPRRLTAIGSVIALLGLALVLDIMGDVRLDSIGVLWGLAAAVGLATYFVLSAKIAGDLPPLVVASAGMTSGAVTLIALGLLGALPMRATFAAVEMAGHRVSWLVPVIGMSVVAGAIAYVAGVVAARSLGASLSSFVGLTEVVFAVLVAWLLLGELPTVMQLVGGALIVAGVVLVHADDARGKALAAA